MIQHFNPDLLGGSSGSTIPGSMPSPTAGFNFATVGASIKDADEQAKKLVEALRYFLFEGGSAKGQAFSWFENLMTTGQAYSMITPLLLVFLSMLLKLDFWGC